MSEIYKRPGGLVASSSIHKTPIATTSSVSFYLNQGDERKVVPGKLNH